MSPNGHVYFTKADYLDDFGKSVRQMAWLIHELTHVYQYQFGRWIKTRAALNRNYNYGDLSKPHPKFGEYGIEQQAAIVEDSFRVSHRVKARNGSGSLSDYQKMLPFYLLDE